jgi:hypothetical protein
MPISSATGEPLLSEAEFEAKEAKFKGKNVAPSFEEVRRGSQDAVCIASRTPKAASPAPARGAGNRLATRSSPQPHPARPSARTLNA